MFAKISTRLYVGFGLLLLLLIAIVVVSVASVKDLQANSDRILQEEVAIGEQAQEIRYLVTRVRQKEKSFFLAIGLTGDDGFEAQKKEWDEYVQELEAAASHFDSLPLSPELKVLSQQMPMQIKAYANIVNTLSSQVLAGTITTPQQADLALEPLKKPIRELSDNLKASFKIAHQGVKDSQKTLDQSAEQIQRNLLIMAAVALALGIVTALLIARSIIAPLNAMQSEIVAIDEGNDLGRRLPLQGGSELQTMAVSINRLLGSLSATLSELQRQSGQLKGSAQQLSTTSAQVKSSSEKQSDQSTSMAAALEEISTSISHIANLSGDAHQMSQQSGAAANDGAQHIRQMVGNIDKIADSIRQAATSAEALDASSDRISSITMVIKDVSDQTNLLALNAAIEAARAGEQGRGFAVVADEVRKLAEKTGQSAQEIAAMISTIQQGAKQMAEQMRVSVHDVEAGMQVAQNAGQTMQHITGSAASVAHLIEEVNVALAEQSSASQMLANRVETIVQMIDDNTRSTAEVAATAQSLDSMADVLRSNISRYRVAS